MLAALVWAVVWLATLLRAQEGLIPTLMHLKPDKVVPDMKRLHGRIRMHGEFWETDCSCSKQSSKLQGRSCNPSKVKVFIDKKGNGLNSEELIAYIGDVKKLDWTKISTSSFSCVDGRRKDNSLSTPGADAGEFLLALHIYSKYFAFQMKMDFKTVNAIFTRYIKLMEMQQFTMCTDDSALRHLSQQLSLEGLDLKNPRQSTRERLLKVLLEPDNIGDMHLRLMLKNHHMYNIDPNLIKNFLKAFFQNLWEGEFKEKLNLVMLIGPHDEKGFIEIRSNAICTKENLAPLMAPLHSGKSMFVNHIDAVQVRRAQLAYFFAVSVNMYSDPISSEKLFNMINQEGISHLEMTGTYIGKELPFYTIHLL